MNQIREVGIDEAYAAMYDAAGSMFSPWSQVEFRMPLEVTLWDDPVPVQPPSYAADEKKGEENGNGRKPKNVYNQFAVAKEDGNEQLYVILSSVAQQANRVESAALTLRGDGRFRTPNVTFTSAVRGVTLSYLEVSHRLFDSYFRYAVVGKDKAPLTDHPSLRAIYSSNNPAEMYLASARNAPGMLALGAWHSTAVGDFPFRQPRLICSKIIGKVSCPNVNTGMSRKDVFNVVKDNGIYLIGRKATNDPKEAEEYIKEMQAELDGISGKKKKKEESSKYTPAQFLVAPSEVGLGHIKPVISPSGNVCTDIVENAKLMLRGLDNVRLKTPKLTQSVRNMIYWWALLGHAASTEAYHLRADCDLRPKEDGIYVVKAKGSKPFLSFKRDVADIESMYNKSVEDAVSAGFDFTDETIEAVSAPWIEDFLAKDLRIKTWKVDKAAAAE